MRQDLAKPSWTYGSVVLGTGNFGGLGGQIAHVGQGYDETAAFAMMDEAVAAGLTLFDTAGRYAWGSGEAIVGRWLRARPAEVTSTVSLATKVAPRWIDHQPGPFDRDWIGPAVTGSLQRIGVDHVDVLFTHAPDDHPMRPPGAGDPTPIEETLEALESSREAGRCRLLGACNIGREQLEVAVAAAERLGVSGYDVVQNEFNLLHPSADADVRTVTRDHGLAYTSHSPLATGILTGKYHRRQAPPPGSSMTLLPDLADELDDQTHAGLDRLRAAAKERGVAPGALALAWQLAHPDVTALTCGPGRRAPHLELVVQAREVAASMDPVEAREMEAWFSRVAD